MKLVFTRSKLLGSFDLIVWGLNEPCSHVAVVFEDKFVVHSSIFGVALDGLCEFYSHREKVFELDYPLPEMMEKYLLHSIVKSKTLLRRYDYKYFFWLFWRGILLKLFRIPLPDRVKVQSRKHTICHEIFDLVSDPRIDRSKLKDCVTPFRLYEALSKAAGQ